MALERRSVRRGRALFAPVVLLAATCLILALLLTVRTTLPIGPFYWDLYIYFDAANRIFDGQVPGVDFFTPVGALGYYLFSLFVWIFPAGQPLLVVQWSLLLVSAPLFGVVLTDVDRRSRFVALSLLIPFLVFSILPFNVEEYYAYPGVDGFGIYNRQVSLLLYVLMAGLVFAELRRTLLVLVAGCMLALLFTKITGLIAGAVLCVLALAAGRLAVRTAIAAALVFALVLAGLELWLGLVSAYAADILLLLEKNEDSLLPRFLQAASLHFGVFASLVALTGVLMVLNARAFIGHARDFARDPALSRVPALFDHDALWLGVALMAALFVETQNTGGLGFIFVWPVLLQLLTRCGRWNGRSLGLVLTLVAASSLPTMVGVMHRAARAFVGQMNYTVVKADGLKTLAAVSQREAIVQHAATMLEAYRRFPDTWQFFADRDELSDFTLYTDPDFQITWLLAAEEAVEAIKAYERANGVRFETIMSLNFVNPFPWLLDRHAPHHIAIGADPYRAVPDPGASVLRAVGGADLVLYPKCPITNANMALRDLYAPGLAGHRLVSLSPCWDAYVK
jgi:hypothetical protein